MTRETKIGMAVAVSFLCLVGVVVATKWHRANDGAKDLVQSVTPSPPPASPGNAAAPNGATEKGTVINAAHTDPNPAPRSPGLGEGLTNALTPPADQINGLKLPPPPIDSGNNAALPASAGV